MKLTSDSNPFMPDVMYKDYRLAVCKVGKGWRAMIYAPGASFALLESPVNLEQSSRESIMVEAKSVVDARCAARSV